MGAPGFFSGYLPAAIRHLGIAQAGGGVFQSGGERRETLLGANFVARRNFNYSGLRGHRSNRLAGAGRS